MFLTEQIRLFLVPSFLSKVEIIKSRKRRIVAIRSIILYIIDMYPLKEI